MERETLLERYMQTAAYQFTPPEPEIPERKPTEAEKLDAKLREFVRRSYIFGETPMVKICDPWIPLWRAWWFPWIS